MLIKSKVDSHSFEISASDVSIISTATHDISPRVRDNFDIFSSKYSNQLLKNRHLYIRNAKIMAILQARHLLLGEIHNWFRRNAFIEITAPILTTLPLYENSTVIPLCLHDQEIFLTQCAGFYLESAVHAFEKSI